MPTIDELLRKMNRERLEADQYHKMASEIKDNPDLQQFLYEMAKHEEEQALALEEKIEHLLEVEKW